jgi:lysylphosphatidylglycerol synthetase-like protein (DUF2156 family)
MFIAHDIAGWLGIPAGIVIAALIILRKKGMALRARKKQDRARRQLRGDAGAGSAPAVG